MATTNLPDVAEWIKIFPKQVTENYINSVTFMRQLTIITVSKIVYLKNVFPEDNYMIETFGGLKLRILKKKCRDDGAQYLSTALIQSFEALDKKYLHKLALCFYDGECKLDNLSEYHVFEYSYYTGGVTMNVHSKTRNNIEKTVKCTFDEVRKSTIEMIQAYTVMLQACQQKLPPNYDFSIRLYYNEDAPENYQAPGYTVSVEEPEDHLASSEHLYNTVGRVETPFHKLVVKCCFKYNMEASHEAIATQNPPVVMTEDTDITLGTSRESGTAVICRCPCNKDDVAEHSQLMGVLTCFYCKTQQHAVCYGLLPEVASRVQRHCCVACADAGGGSGSSGERIPTDIRLAGLSAWRRESLCMFRRSLVWCWDRGTVSCPVLQDLGAAPHNARRLLRQLHHCGVVEYDDMDASQLVDMDKLKQVMGKHFPSMGDDSIADQLLEETFSSQENRHDPVGAMLDPMEKVTLQKAAYPGELLEPVRFQPAEKDPTLQQYEKALLSCKSNTEDMSLLEVLKKEKLRKSKRKVEKVTKSILKTGVKTKRVCFMNN